MNKPLVTRKELVTLVRDQTGIPLTLGRINKLAMRNEGPPVAGKYGPSDLIDPDAGIAWALSKFVRASEAA